MPCVFSFFLLKFFLSPAEPVSLAECLVLWFCVSLLCDRHRPSSVHPYRVGVPVVGRTVFRLPINPFCEIPLCGGGVPSLLFGLCVFLSFALSLHSKIEDESGYRFAPHTTLNLG